MTKDRTVEEIANEIRDKIDIGIRENESYVELASKSRTLWIEALQKKQDRIEQLESEMGYHEAKDVIEQLKLRIEELEVENEKLKKDLCLWSELPPVVLNQRAKLDKAVEALKEIMSDWNYSGVSHKHLDDSTDKKSKSYIKANEVLSEIEGKP